ncbi:MAG: four helix bundle protein [Candidatus Andersenbacteria bacterium]
MVQQPFHSAWNTPPQPSPDAPILQRASLAYKTWYGTLPNLPRLAHQGIGGRIETLFLDLITRLLQACFASPKRKADLIRAASSTLDTLKFFLQIAWELKLIDHKKYAHISTPLAEVGRMLGGWQKSATKKPATFGYGPS